MVINSSGAVELISIGDLAAAGGVLVCNKCGLSFVLVGLESIFSKTVEIVVVGPLKKWFYPRGFDFPSPLAGNPVQSPGMSS